MTGNLLSWLRGAFGAAKAPATAGAANAATAIGMRNTIIQMIGVQGSARPFDLRPVRFVEQPQDGAGVAVHLEWRTRLMTLQGRTKELADLRAWLAQDHAVSFKVVFGEGGMGKTRLAAELAVLPDVASAWRSGWVDLATLQASDRLQATGNWLLLVDYPEHNPAQLVHLAEAVTRCDVPGARVRVLLLARQWEAPTALLKEGRAAADLAAPMRIGPPPADDSFEAFQSALAKLGVAVQDESALRLAFTQWQQQNPLHCAPLFVAALAVDVHAAGRALDGSAWLVGKELLQSLVARETSRWTGAERGAGAPGGSVGQVMLWAALAGGLDARAVNAVLDALGVNTPEQRACVHRALAALGASNARGHVAALQPDLLAALWVTTWLGRPEHQQPPETQAVPLVAALSGRDPRAVVQRLNMLAYDQAVRLGAARVGDGGHLDSWLCGLASTSAALRELIVRGLGAHATPVGLPLVVAYAAGEGIAEASVGTEPGNAPSEAARAANLNSFSVRLSDVGQRHAALAPVQKAVQIYRRLAQASPAAYESGFAASLHNLASVLYALGQRQDALAPAQEAVDIYRRRARDNPTADEPYLAASLNNLANVLSALGQRQHALGPAQESLDIRRRLAEANPTAYEPGLAGTLNNLSNRLCALGQRPAALELAQEGVRIYRRLAEENPAAYEPELAGSLTNLANRMSEMGQHDAALRPAQEAVEIYRRLAQANPVAYERGLAASLNNLASRLTNVDQHETALVHAQGAVSIYRRLAQLDPTAYVSDLATSLHNVANLLGVLSQHEAALDPAQEAVDIRRSLAAANPAAYEPDLAASLNNLAGSLSALGRQSALRLVQEAVDLRRRSAVAHPAAYEPDLAMSLGMLMVVLHTGGDQAAACIAGKECLALFTRLAAQEPDAFERRRAATERLVRAIGCT